MAQSGAWAALSPARTGLGARSRLAWPALLAAGAAAALAQPPWSILPGLLGFGLIFRLVDAAREAPARSAFFRGWLGGLGYFLVSLTWIAEPFQVDAREQGWMGPLADPVVSAFLALFWGLAALVWRSAAGRGSLRAVFFAGCLALAEWLRGHVLGGFPWDLPGEAWRAGTPVAQAGALVGAYGMSLLTLAVACALFVAFEGRRGAALAAGAAALIAVLWGLGAMRLTHPAQVPPGALRVRIVQADVRQETKYDQAMFAGIVRRYLDLTSRPAQPPPQVVIWPEGAIPAAIDDYLAPDAWPRPAIAAALPEGAHLILGAYRFGPATTGEPPTYNSLMVLGAGADGLAQEGVYDKHRLVPFGEFMPLPDLARAIGLEQMVHVGDGFSAGPPPRPMRIAGLPPFQPLICYEALFPGFAQAGQHAAGVRPAWIVNISNDAWFGTGSGPRQHLNMAAWRAMEEGLPMARATPTGISALIDPYGRIVRSLDEHVYGVIDAPLPAALGPTLYSRVGDLLFFVLLVLTLVGARLTGRLRILVRGRRR